MRQIKDCSPTEERTEDIDACQEKRLEYQIDCNYEDKIQKFGKYQN